MKKNEGSIFLYGAAFSVNLLSYCIGSGYSWTSPVLPKLNSNDSTINPLPVPTTTFEESWITSLLSMGAAIGPFIASPIAEKNGRKTTLLLFSFLILLSHLLFAFATNVSFFLAGRFILGIGLGCVFSVLPSYVGEISEDSNRGLLGCIMGLLIVIGTLFNYVIGPYVSVKVFSFINIVPVVLFYMSFTPFVPESPYYYVSINEATKAENSLKKLRNKSEGAIKKELLFITECVLEAKNNQGTFLDLFKSKELIKGLVISSGLMILQQLSGICAVLAYMQSIFDASGSTIPSHISVMMIGAIQVIITVFTTSLVDRLGRKILLLLSTIGSFLSLMSLGTYFYLKNNNINVDKMLWLPTVSLIVFIISYNLGLGALPWTIMGELFSSNVKSVASSISSCVCLTTAFFITMFFPYLAISLGMAGSFWLFAVFCGVGIIFTIFVVPETKGKSLLEIQFLLGKSKK